MALCADGPRQNAKLKPWAATWEKLPAGSFQEQGTGVNVAKLTYTRPKEEAPKLKQTWWADIGGGRMVMMSC